MNPFDLRGPEFLAFYFAFSLVVILTIVILRRVAESGDTPKIELDDPYLIAYLRGGESEALRVAVISLVDRGLLLMNDQIIRRADHVTENTAKNQIEYEVLNRLGAPTKATSVLKDERLKAAFQPYRDKLERAGLVPDAATRAARLKRLLLALLALGVVGGIKIQIGLSLERPIGFLVFMMIVAMIVAFVSSFPRLTARGKATLEDITNLYSELKTRANSFSPGSATAELAMLVAVFGVEALAATSSGYARSLFPQAGGSHGGSSCSSFDSSSCGSSDGGSGCGGGGCGGCGS